MIQPAQLLRLRAAPASPAPFVAGTGLMGATAPGQIVTKQNVGNLPPGSVVRDFDGARLIHLHDDLWLWLNDCAWCYSSVEMLFPRMNRPVLCHMPVARGTEVNPQRD